MCLFQSYWIDFGSSKLYVSGDLLVENDGLHGMLEKCAEIPLESGQHMIYVEGFQNRGGVGMELKYKGPDTIVDGGEQKLFVRSGLLPLSFTLASKRQYFALSASNNAARLRAVASRGQQSSRYSALYQLPERLTNFQVSRFWNAYRNESAVMIS